MKKQWTKFLEDNASEWSYGIVPSLVKRLDEALKAGDDETVQETFDSLAAQGVILDEDGNLRFIMDIGSNLEL
jgi:hypothetical protein